MALFNFSPSNQSEVIVHSSWHGNLISNISAHWLQELYTDCVFFHGYDFTCKWLRSNIDHENLCCLQWTDLSCSFLTFSNILILCFNTEKSFKKEIWNINFTQNLRHLIWVSYDLSNKRIRPCDIRIYFHTYTDKSSWYSVHKLVVISLKRCDLRFNFSPLNDTCFLIPCNETWSDWNFVSNLKNTLQNCSSSNTTFKVFSLFSRLVDIERSNDDHLRWRHKISDRKWDSA